MLQERLKALFDEEYDGQEDESKHFVELKQEVDAQSRLNKEFFSDEPHREK